MKKTKKILFIITAILFLSLPVLTGVTEPLRVEAAAVSATGWKQEGKSWYYYKSGKKQTGWLNLSGKRYYLDSKANGRMVVGGKTIGKYFYSFASDGAMRTSMWVKDTKNRWYYFQKNGTGIRSGWLKYKNDYYRFGSNCVMLTGFQTVNGKKYYFNTKQTVESGKTYKVGCRRTGWVKISSKWYYFDKNGVMYKGWLTSGGKRYLLQSNGVMKTGWYTSNAGNKYYLDVPDGDMITNTTKVIDGGTWKFSSNGTAKKVTHTITSGGQVKVEENGKSYTLKKEFASHPGVADNTLTDEELLAAVVYCEAGDQGLAGMTAVALTILNRTEPSQTYYPDTLRYIIYQSGQYSVVENGSLLRRLKNPNGDEASNCKKAVKAAYNTIKKYRSNGTPRRVAGISTSMMGGKKDFDSIYFMMRYSFNGLGLNWDKCDTFQYKDHVFFTKWVD